MMMQPSHRFKKLSTVKFSDGTRAEYESFRDSIRSQAAVMEWTHREFGQEVFMSLSGKAADRIRTMSDADKCNGEKLLARLNEAFLPNNYAMAVMDDFKALKYDKNKTLKDFYENL